LSPMPVTDSTSRISLYCSGGHRSRLSFPTRRSSELNQTPAREGSRRAARYRSGVRFGTCQIAGAERLRQPCAQRGRPACYVFGRSEEHTSELQSSENLVCRLLLEKKNTD